MFDGFFDAISDFGTGIVEDVRSFAEDVDGKDFRPNIEFDFDWDIDIEEEESLDWNDI